MSKLEEIYLKCLNIENKYSKKQILYIGSESYDSATITIIEGLSKFGFKILVYKKKNINSWFCNQIIDSLDNIENNIDFVLSNLHWGTRWDYYKQLKHKVPYILIDGDDRIHGNQESDWKDKYLLNCKNYQMNPPDEIKDLELSPFRWMVDIENYQPDKIFMTQKYKINKNCTYLPFGIQDTYINLNKNIIDKEYDITHIPGPGEQRERVEIVLNNVKNQNKLNIFNSKIYGNIINNSNIEYYCKHDKNIHSWHRWNTNQNYYDVLNKSKILIYPSIDKANAPGWDSKRPWEAIALGCLLLYHTPPDFDNSEYPLDEICNISQFEYNDYSQMFNICKFLIDNPKILNKKTKESCNNGIRYFTSLPITRYFLYNIQNLN